MSRVEFECENCGSIAKGKWVSDGDADMWICADCLEDPPSDPEKEFGSRPH